MRFLSYGFGDIGRRIAALALRRGHECVGVIDSNPDLVGRDAGELMGMARLGLTVSGDAEQTIRNSIPEVVFHATGSYLDRVYPQILSCIRNGASLVSTCETLVYPHYRYPNIAEILHRKAKENRVVVLGAGINPGFLLDYLPAVMTAVCSEVESITAVRSLDAAKRRPSFQRKIGIGLGVDEWRAAAESGAVTGHVGYAESTLLLVDMLGLRWVSVKESQEPIIEDGAAAGIRGSARAETREGVIVEIDLVAKLLNEEY